ERRVAKAGEDGGSGVAGAVVRKLCDEAGEEGVCGLEGFQEGKGGVLVFRRGSRIPVEGENKSGNFGIVAVGDVAERSKGAKAQWVVGVDHDGFERWDQWLCGGAEPDDQFDRVSALVYPEWRERDRILQCGRCRITKVGQGDKGLFGELWIGVVALE